MPGAIKDQLEPDVLPMTPHGPGLLIVDADRSERLQLAQDLTAAGFSVWTAPSGEAALDTYLRHTGDIDVLLLSVSLPDLPATEFLGWIRRHYPGVPCCCLARVDELAAAAKVKAAGGLVLFRPLSFHRLTAVIRRLASDASQPDRPDLGSTFTEWQVVPDPGRGG
jgi:DNA-binding response OmpR family regulator